MRRSSTRFGPLFQQPNVRLPWAGTHGGQASITAQFYLDLNTFQPAIYIVPEAGLAPLSWFQRNRLSNGVTLGFGVSFNADSLDDIAGYTANAYWPAVAMWRFNAGKGLGATLRLSKWMTFLEVM